MQRTWLFTWDISKLSQTSTTIRGYKINTKLMKKNMFLVSIIWYPFVFLRIYKIRWIKSTKYCQNKHLPLLWYFIQVMDLRIIWVNCYHVIRENCLMQVKFTSLIMFIRCTCDSIIMGRYRHEGRWYFEHQ